MTEHEKAVGRGRPDADALRAQAEPAELREQSPQGGDDPAADRDRQAEALVAGELGLVEVLAQAARDRAAATRDWIAAAEDRLAAAKDRVRWTQMAAKAALEQAKAALDRARTAADRDQAAIDRAQAAEDRAQRWRTGRGPRMTAGWLAATASARAMLVDR